MLSTSDRIVVMRDGKVVASDAAAGFDRDRLVATMGGAGRAPRRPRRGRARADGAGDGARPALGAGRRRRARRARGRDHRPRRPRRPRPDPAAARVFEAATARSAARSTVAAPVALVAGDRQADGIFPLWSIAENIGIRSLARLAPRPLRSRPSARPSSPRVWQQRIGIRTPDLDNNILSLSGGNQQKALFARALGSDARIILMDDPMRGVDIGTKLEVYDLIREEARQRPHLPLVHDRDRGARQLRPRLCLPQRPHRRRARPQRADRGERHPVLVRGGGRVTAASVPPRPSAARSGPRACCARCCRPCRWR